MRVDSGGGVMGARSICGWTLSACGSRRDAGARGFSLVEMMLAMLLAAGSMVAALQVVAASGKSEAWAVRQAIGHRLATELLAEICAQDFEHGTTPGTFGIEVGLDPVVVGRIDLNDVDDFRDWSEQPPENRDGTPRTDLSGWSRRAVVERVSLVAPEGGVVAYDSRVKRVRVEVAYQGVPVASLSAIRTGAWDDARAGRDGTRPPVGVTSDGLLVEVLDATGTLLDGAGDLIGGVLGGLLGGG